MTDEAQATVAGEIRAELARQGREQQELARQLGHKPSWLSRRLSGETKMSVGDLKAIARMLGVPVAQLAKPLDDE